MFHINMSTIELFSCLLAGVSVWRVKRYEHISQVGISSAMMRRLKIPGLDQLDK